MAPLVAPGAMFPLSNDPSFITMRWTTLSEFCQAMALPWGIGAGFGLNDWSFLWPMMVTVMAGDAEVVGVDDGIGLDDEPLLPHPHAARTQIATANFRDRMPEN